MIKKLFNEEAYLTIYVSICRKDLNKWHCAAITTAALSITETTAADASSVDLAAVIKPMVFFNEGWFIRYIYITVYEKHGLC